MKQKIQTQKIITEETNVPICNCCKKPLPDFYNIIENKINYHYCNSNFHFSKKSRTISEEEDCNYESFDAEFCYDCANKITKTLENIGITFDKTILRIDEN